MESSQSHSSSALGCSQGTSEPFSEEEGSCWPGEAEEEGSCWPGEAEEEGSCWPGEAEEEGSCWPGEAEEEGSCWPGEAEEEGSQWQGQSEPSGACWSPEGLEGSALLGPLPSTSPVAGQSQAGEQSEVDSAAAQRDVLGRWVELQKKEAGNQQDKPGLKPQPERTGWLDGELAALGSFCTMKISKMQQQLISEQAKGGRRRKLQHGLTAKNAEMRDWSCPVPEQLISRICLQNVRETVKQVTEAEIHQCSACPECQKQAAELARIAFLRRKKVLLENALIQQKLEERIYSTNVLTLLGEALRSLPKPSEDPRNLWQRLKGQNYVKPESSKHNPRT